MSALSKKKKIVSKDELRRLMKQTKSTIKKETKKIDHPYAKYNSLGQLLCILCGTSVKSELIWPAHLQSKSHKELLLGVQSKPLAVKRPIVEHNAEDNPEHPSKKLKGNKNNTDTSSGLPADFFDSKSAEGTGKANLGISSYSSSEDEEETPQKNLSSALPADFFDSVPMKTTEPEAAEEPKKMADVLPEGFFDDPKQDAKARQIEYKDRMEEEWEMFQRSMKEESHVSEIIVDEDDEQANFDRNIDEIDEQIQKLQEVNELQNKKDEIMKCAKDVKSNDSDSDELDEEDINDFFDWRSKKSWK